MSPPIRVILVTVSDTRTAENDDAGRALRDELASFSLVRHIIVPDSAETLRKIVFDVEAKDEADAIVLAGGTGIAPRDVTLDALAPVFDKELHGFREAFRRLSSDEIGPRAILSRAHAGTVGRCILFLLPGSEKAARLGARAHIAPILSHAVDLVNDRTAHREPVANS